MTTWLKHVQDWDGCQRCALGQQRSSMCFGRSEWPQGADRPNLRLPCDVVLVGEAPGISEDAAGYPFVGPAGLHLDLIVNRAFDGLESSVSVAFTNLVACFPRQAKERGDNEPERGEVLECRPRLVEFVNLARPRLIVRVGKMAQHYLRFDTSVPYADIEHPASIVRMVAARKVPATQRCVMQLRNAWQSVLQSPRRQWTEWGVNHAEGKTAYRQHLDDLYGDIPF